MPFYGYARVSTKKDKQDVKRQIFDLTAKGAEKIYQEHASGMKADRPELEKLLSRLKEGDTLAVTEVSRLTRSLHQLCHILEDAEAKQIKLICGSLVVDYTGAAATEPMTRAMLQFMGVFSELERNLTVERIKSGLANAKAGGARMGRPKKTVRDVPENVTTLLPDYRAGKFGKSEFARKAGISRPALYKYLKLLGEK